MNLNNKSKDICIHKVCRYEGANAVDENNVVDIEKNDAIPHSFLHHSHPSE